MLESKNHVALKVVTAFMVCLFLQVSLYSLVSCNGSEGAYCEGCVRKSDRGMEPLGRLIENGAANFLQAHSEYLHFSSLYEMQGDELDYSLWRQRIHSCMEKLRNARDIYSNLIDSAESTPYNQKAIDKLRDFDYNEYMKENRLNPIIFKHVEVYLSTGNITNAYRFIHKQLILIENSLITIENAINTESIPELSEVWVANENFSSTLLFGQYIARVFYNL
ncbi:MAG: hypothetical protein GY757_39895 [bacterium]|nr:hypothetical protein [bacterium]